MTIPPVDFPFDDAQTSSDALVAILQQAVASNRHAWHLMSVASIGLDQTPEVRTVVLRGFDAEERTFRFHTDWRSPKIAEFQRNPLAMLLMYDPLTRLQLRVPVTIELHHQDDIAWQAWAKCQDYSRTCYAVPNAPSAVLATDDWPTVPPMPSIDDASVYANMCVVVCRYSRLELLHLRAGGHRRAWLDWRSGTVEMTRVAP